jgi:hypothetical protein
VLAKKILKGRQVPVKKNYIKKKVGAYQELKRDMRSGQARLEQLKNDIGAIRAGQSKSGKKLSC